MPPADALGRTAMGNEEALLDAYVLRYADEVSPDTLSEWVLRCPSRGPLGDSPVQLQPALEVAPALACRIETRLRRATATCWQPSPCIKGAGSLRPSRVQWHYPVEDGVQDPDMEVACTWHAASLRAASPHPRASRASANKDPEKEVQSWNSAPRAASPHPRARAVTQVEEHQEPTASTPSHYGSYSPSGWSGWSYSWRWNRNSWDQWNSRSWWDQQEGRRGSLGWGWNDWDQSQSRWHWRDTDNWSSWKQWPSTDAPDEQGRWTSSPRSSRESFSTGASEA